MKTDARNFSLVAYLTGEEYKKVRDLQKTLSATTGSRKCLEDWLPHVTIGDAILVPDDAIENLETELFDISSSQNIFSANIKGFGGTEHWKGAVENKITPYVIWLEVVLSPELLQLFSTLRDKVTTHYDSWLPRTLNYTPHVTLAFADLTEEGYKKGMEYLASQKIELPFSVSHIALVECYGEGNMTSMEDEKFYFKKKVS